MRAYNLTNTMIRNLIPKQIPGLYYLGELLNNKFHILYVGRSDTCLRTRLEQHAKKGIFSFFRFRTTKNKKLAYKRECYAYHSHKKLINKIHPAHNGIHDCPICSCIDEFQTALPEFKN